MHEMPQSAVLMMAPIAIYPRVGVTSTITGLSKETGVAIVLGGNKNESAGGAIYEISEEGWRCEKF